jgi:hypothetical protein
MKVLFREINQVLEILKQLGNIHRHTMSLRLHRRRKSYKDMEMNWMES